MTGPRGWTLALPPVAGLAAVVAATAKGLYVSPDAVFYVGTARNWLDGRGFVPPQGLPPLDHFPPLFTLVLAGIARAGGIDPLDAARMVNALAFAVTVLLVGLVVRRATGSVPATLVASVLTVAAVDLLTYSASALSEPLFVLLAVAGLVVLARHLERPRRAVLVTAAVLVAAAFLTRYVGAAAVVSGVGVLAWRRWWADAAVFGVVSAAPCLGFLAWAEGGDRKVVLHMFDWDYLGQAARPFSRWLVPWPKPPVGLTVALGLVVAGIVVMRRRRPTASVPSGLPQVLAVFAVAYLAVVLANRALADATGRLDARFLAPLHVVAILLVVPALHRRRVAGPVVAVLVLAQVADAVAWTAGGLTDDSVRRRGYAAAAWETSPVLAFVAANEGPYHSNAPDLIAFRTDRHASLLPANADYLTGRVNRDHLRQLRALRGYIVYFDAVTFRGSLLPSSVELEWNLDLEVVVEDDVGTLYRIR